MRGNLEQADVWSCMADAVTDPVKQVAELGQYVDKGTGNVRCDFIDLVEIEAGIMYNWESDGEDDDQAPAPWLLFAIVRVGDPPKRSITEAATRLCPFPNISPRDNQSLQLRSTLVAPLTKDFEVKLFPHEFDLGASPANIDLGASLALMTHRVGGGRVSPTPQR